MRRAHSVLAASAALALIATRAYADPRIAVVPYAPVDGRVPENAGIELASRLAEQLRAGGGFDVVELPIAPPADTGDLDQARAKLTALRRPAAHLRADVREARAVLDAVERSAPRVSVEDLSDAHVALAIALYMDAQDTEGARELEKAVALTPARRFEGEESSLLFRAVADRARDAVFDAAPGTLLIDSAPRGARVFLDGQEIGRTPVTVHRLAAGGHLWRVALAASEPVGGIAAIEPRARVAVTAQLVGDSAATALNRLLVSNALDGAALEAVRQVARSAGADLVAFGALGVQDASIVAESFVFVVASNRVARLGRQTFDSALVGAGPAMLAVATELAGWATHSPEQVPTALLAGAPKPEAFGMRTCAMAPPAAATKPAEVAAGGRTPVTAKTRAAGMKDRERDPAFATVEFADATQRIGPRQPRTHGPVTSGSHGPLNDRDQGSWPILLEGGPASGDTLPCISEEKP